MMNAFLDKRNKLDSYRKLRKKKTELHPVGGYIRLVADEGSVSEIYSDMISHDPLHFPGYMKKLENERAKAEAEDSFTLVKAKINGTDVILGELSKFFMMGSMGTVAGRKIAAVFEIAGREKKPLVIFSASGGARMQEGMYSLMQMAGTSAACERFKENGGLFISVLTNPCMGGVSASYASLGDIIIAESGALIGFAGQRVIEQTIGEKLPQGFQRSEFQLAHGACDMVVSRSEMKKVISNLLILHGYGKKSEKVISINELREKSGNNTLLTDFNKNINEISPKKLSGYDRLLIARDRKRPKTEDFINALFSDFTELSGDRLGMEDRAIIAGIGLFDKIPVTIIGHRKGHDIQENIRSNFGMPEPNGYRKAARLMKEAEKFGRPVITFIDTPGAYPGKEAEENGQSAAIAENLALMSTLKVPIINIITGEGNSGGALAIGMGDRAIMLSNAVYSVLSPEGFASILWKEKGRVREACEVMKMTAYDMLDSGVVDEVINR